MEKFSTWRDPGTGIQPFLTPIPPAQGASQALKIYTPLGYIIGAVRTVLFAVPLALYIVGRILGLLLTPVPPLRRVVSNIFTAISARLALVLLGLLWIPVDVVTRKKGRSTGPPGTWNPGRGDVIVSNWCSWIELLYLAFRWNPIFLLPIAEEPSSTDSRPSTAQSTPGRRTGTGSAAISTPSNASRTRVPILGWKQASLLEMISHSGYGPLPPRKGAAAPLSLEQIRAKADRPVVVFPECTTSNGRAVLRFADVFSNVSVPVKGFSVFLMCVRYDPPTPADPSLSHSIPSSRVPNPIPHLFTLLASPALNRTMSVRLLEPSDSPSSQTFVASDFLAPGAKDQLGEACAQLIAQLGKFKRTTVLGWEEKSAFLEFYRQKT
ncbi:hypothetical protein FRC04_010588 [Tulasnella sp. 424]|nr:hypothetical protein FRC04_010588 [Tulasnella sp. 424]KAG8972323.1 hypothetical protein FRC05_010165 [Tulasnella sp. 425]